MDYVKQACELSADKKQQAVSLYKSAVIELVNKNYVLRIDDAHTELSAIFGQNWLIANKSNGKFWLDKSLFAEANIAFNYANLTLGISGRFVALAESLVNAEQRISNKQLKAISKQMDSILTATTANYFEIN
jgi:hypothetical protein